jgi:hypothetical protein
MKNDRLKLLEQRLRDWGRFCWRQESSQAGNYGNSPTHRLMEGGKLGLMSFGTAYLDNRSDTEHEPEWFQAINAPITQLQTKHIRVLRTCYVVDPKIQELRRFKPETMIWKRRIAATTTMTPHVFGSLLREAQLMLLGEF